jgi:hypothetical protein
LAYGILSAAFIPICETQMSKNVIAISYDRSGNLQYKIE